MAKEVDKNEIVYQVTLDPYKISVNTKDNKKIFLDDKQIGISVGGHLSAGGEFKSTLLIDIHYDSDTTETLTKPIPQLESFGSIIALNPEFKNKRVIDKLTELGIISKPLETVNYKKQDYDLVKVNLEELLSYKPFGDSILNDYISIEKHRQSQKEKEL